MRQRRLVTAFLVSALALASRSARAQYSCAGISPTSNTALSSVVIANGLTQPVFVTAVPGDTGRIFILERTGRIRIHKRGQQPGTLLTFLDITAKVDSSSDQEMGLLGLAFDPDYATTRHFWIFYSETVAGQVYSVIAQYTTTIANPDAADATSEVRVLRYPKPETNHNGGMLTFGPDGFLYIFVGDGGGGGDLHGACGNGQNRSVLLAKILRLDVRGIDPGSTPPDCGQAGAPYRVPASNPLSDGPGVGACDEIWAYGVRNPWRSTFDAATGDLYIGDVGQDCWEEIDWQPQASPGGQNYGWRQMEGYQCYNPADTSTCTPAGATCAGSPPCNDPSITLPVLNYSHAFGCAEIGGYVYRGCRMPGFSGTYFYGDECSGFVNTLVMSGGVATNQQSVTSQVDPTGQLPGNLSSFGVDGQGELFTVALSGTVKKIVPPFTDLEVSGAGAASELLLSKTGTWTWEDLYQSTEEPVNFYRVYRGTIGGAYTCVLKTALPMWSSGGDPTNPAPGHLNTYVVTAVSPTSQESKPGTSGTFNASTCP
jgi:glucose/arabinose dehydrogenase